MIKFFSLVRALFCRLVQMQFDRYMAFVSALSLIYAFTYLSCEVIRGANASDYVIRTSVFISMMPATGFFLLYFFNRNAVIKRFKKLSSKTCIRKGESGILYAVLKYIFYFLIMLATAIGVYQYLSPLGFWINMVIFQVELLVLSALYSLPAKNWKELARKTAKFLFPLKKCWPLILLYPGIFFFVYIDPINSGDTRLGELLLITTVSILAVGIFLTSLAKVLKKMAPDTTKDVLRILMLPYRVVWKTTLLLLSRYSLNYRDIQAVSIALAIIVLYVVPHTLEYLRDMLEYFGMSTDMFFSGEAEFLTTENLSMVILVIFVVMNFVNTPDYHKWKSPENPLYLISEILLYVIFKFPIFVWLLLFIFMLREIISAVGSDFVAIAGIFTSPLYVSRVIALCDTFLFYFVRSELEVNEQPHDKT